MTHSDDFFTTVFGAFYEKQEWRSASISDNGWNTDSQLQTRIGNSISVVNICWNGAQKTWKQTQFAKNYFHQDNARAYKSVLAMEIERIYTWKAGISTLFRRFRSLGFTCFENSNIFRAVQRFSSNQEAFEFVDDLKHFQQSTAIGQSWMKCISIKYVQNRAFNYFDHPRRI